MANQNSEKLNAARRAVRLVQNGMRLGLGSGSTAAYAIQFLGDRIRDEGLAVVGVPTSPASRELSLKSGVPLLDDDGSFELDLAIDGADELTREGHIVKGGGGALLHERLVAVAAKRFVVIADSSKLVPALGAFPLPVEVYQFSWRNTSGRIEALGSKATRREKNGTPFVSEEGNFILDCIFDGTTLQSPEALAQTLDAIPGVADHGLFLGMAHLAIIGRGDDVEEIPLRY